MRSQESLHFFTGEISTFFRASARNGRHKSADSRSDLQFGAIGDGRKLANQSRIAGILPHNEIPPVAKRPLGKMRGWLRYEVEKKMAPSAE
jgi:hypothetical protein